MANWSDPRTTVSAAAAPVGTRTEAVDAGLRGYMLSVYNYMASGVLLTGMGDDGARGLLAMRQAGARTLAQDEASCVVYGMPKAAVELGAVEQVQALSDMGQAIMDTLTRSVS